RRQRLRDACRDGLAVGRLFHGPTPTTVASLGKRRRRLLPRGDVHLGGLARRIPGAPCDGWLPAAALSGDSHPLANLDGCSDRSRVRRHRVGYVLGKVEDNRPTEG